MEITTQVNGKIVQDMEKEQFNIDEYGNYYVGEFKNGLRHGKGIIYYKKRIY